MVMAEKNECNINLMDMDLLIIFNTEDKRSVAYFGEEQQCAILC